MSPSPKKSSSKDKIAGLPKKALVQTSQGKKTAYYAYSYTKPNGDQSYERDYIGSVVNEKFIPNRTFLSQGCPKWETRPRVNIKVPSRFPADIERSWRIVELPIVSDSETLPEPAASVQPETTAEPVSSTESETESVSADEPLTPSAPLPQEPYSEPATQPAPCDEGLAAGDSLSVGATALASAILEHTHLKQDLFTVLGSAQDMVTACNLAMHAAITTDPTYLACREATVQKFIGKMRLTSPRASEFFQRIGADTALSVKMGKARISHVVNGSFLAIDGTQLPSASRNIDLSKIGKTKEGGFGKQINVSFLVNAKSGDVLSYRLYAGNINDVSTLSDQRLLWDEIGLADKDVVIAGDRGYLKTQEAIQIDQSGYKFLFGAKVGNKVIDEIIKDRNTELYQPSNFLGNRLKCYGIKQATALSFGSQKSNINAYVYRSTKMQEEMIGELQTNLRFFQSDWSEASASERIKLRSNPLYDYFVERGGKLTFDASFFDEQCYTKGFFALVSNVDFSVSQALDHYHERNMVEVDFKLLFKHLLGSSRAHSTVSFNGLMLVTFVALGILTYLNYKMNEVIDNERSKKKTSVIKDLYSVGELLKDLRRIKMTYDAKGNPRLLNVTNRDRHLAEAFGFPGLFDDPQRVAKLLSNSAHLEQFSQPATIGDAS